jgi:hypothetical protein
MKTIKNYTVFVNENIKENFVDVELDQDVINYYLEIVDKGVPKEDAIKQVSADFGISDDAVAIIVDEAGIKESVKSEEEEEDDIIEEAKKDDDKDDKKDDDKEDDKDKSDEDKYLTAKQKKLPEGLKKAIIKKAKAKK